MKTRKFFSPTSRVRFGLARADITPPPGILHRLWGAARHTQAAGVHRPLVADVMVFGPVDGTSDPPLIRAHLDWGGCPCAGMRIWCRRWARLRVSLPTASFWPVLIPTRPGGGPSRTRRNPCPEAR